VVNLGQKQSLGRLGENLACDFLINRGYCLVGRNVRTPYGEIDIIFTEGQRIMFVEVKTRTSLRYGLPETAITPKKRSAIIQGAEAFMLLHPEYENYDWQVDVISILLTDNNDPQIEWFQNAVL
jgi:putative endonuclease